MSVYNSNKAIDIQQRSAALTFEVVNPRASIDTYLFLALKPKRLTHAMLTPPSPVPTPSLTSRDNITSRKRQRSLSSQSESSSASAKRSMSQDPNSDTHETPRPKDMSTLSINDSTNDTDIDAYMAEQGMSSGEATAPAHPVHALAPTPLITMNDGVATASSASQAAISTSARRLDLIKELCKESLKPGDIWYLVSRRWYRRWEKACSGEEDKDGPVEEKDLGPVDNTSLVDSLGNLVSSAIEHVDVEFIPEAAWNLFAAWYVYHFALPDLFASGTRGGVCTTCICENHSTLAADFLFSH
jgi:ubiquitin carboxyl-terminal hydrolase 4/11